MVTSFNVSLVGDVNSENLAHMLEDKEHVYHVDLGVDVCEGVDIETLKAGYRKSKVIAIQNKLRTKGIERSKAIEKLKAQFPKITVHDYVAPDRAASVAAKEAEQRNTIRLIIAAAKGVDPSTITDEALNAMIEAVKK